MRAEATLIVLLISACHGPEPVAFAPNKETAICAVKRVVDGDTLDVTCKSGARAMIRIVGYDTPETYRPKCAAEAELGKRATARLTQILNEAKILGFEALGPDKYNRMLARVIVNGRDITDQMVQEGLAVRYDGGKRINWCERLQA